MPSDRNSVLTPRSVNPKFQIQIDTNFSPNSYDSLESKQLMSNTYMHQAQFNSAFSSPKFFFQRRNKIASEANS